MTNTPMPGNSATNPQPEPAKVAPGANPPVPVEPAKTPEPDSRLKS